MIQQVLPYTPVYQPVVLAPPSDVKSELKAIHKNYYPDLTEDEFALEGKSLNELLYKRNKFLQLAKYGTYKNNEDTYGRIKDNPDFKELINSKYLKSAQGFVNFISDMATLEEKRAKGMIVPSNPYAMVGYSRPIPYEKYDMKDYLKMLNDMTKNPKISDDLKQYLISVSAGDLNMYYTKFDKLDKTSDVMNLLIERT